MTPHQRFVRALRDAADAYEEIACGKAKRPRRRGPIGPVAGVEATPEERAEANAILDRTLPRAGLRRLG